MTGHNMQNKCKHCQNFVPFGGYTDHITKCQAYGDFLKQSKYKDDYSKWMKCDKCNKSFLRGAVYVTHAKFCQFYSEFIKKEDEKSFCSLCLVELKYYGGIIHHLKNSHPALNMRIEKEISLKNFDEISNKPKVIELSDSPPKQSIEIVKLQANETSNMTEFPTQDPIEKAIFKLIDEKSASKKYECMNCQVRSMIVAYKSHLEACKLYSKSMIKYMEEYQCKDCTFRSKRRLNMINHVKKFHLNKNEKLHGKLYEAKLVQNKLTKINLKNGIIDENRNINTMNKLSGITIECGHCYEMILLSSYHGPVEPCELCSKLMTKTKLGYECSLCTTKKVFKTHLFTHIRTEHSKDEIIVETQNKNNFENEEIDSKNEHSKSVNQDLSEFIASKTCLICDTQFDSIEEVEKHVKEEHLNIMLLSLIDKESDSVEITPKENKEKHFEEKNSNQSNIINILSTSDEEQSESQGSKEGINSIYENYIEKKPSPSNSFDKDTSSETSNLNKVRNIQNSESSDLSSDDEQSDLDESNSNHKNDKAKSDSDDFVNDTSFETSKSNLDSNHNISKKPTENEGHFENEAVAVNDVDKKCEICQDKILIGIYEKHLEPCKMYSEFIKRTENENQCTICLLKFPRKFQMYNLFRMYSHIKEEHSIEELNSELMSRNQENNKKRAGSTNLVNDTSFGTSNLNTMTQIKGNHQKRAKLDHWVIESKELKSNIQNEENWMIKNSNKEYQCQICLSKSTTRLKMVNHIKNFHMDKNGGANSVHISSNTHEKKEIFQSKVEDREYSKNQIKSDHFEDLNETLQKFQCSLCKIKVETLECGQEHISSYHGIKNFQKSFIIRSDLVETNENPTYNKKEAKSDQILNKNESQFQCALCKIKLESLQDGEVHMSEFHRISMKNSPNPLIIRGHS